MAILMRAEVSGQTQQGYQEVFDALRPLYAGARGFVAHFSYPIEGGWCVVDVWDSREQFESFFGQNVVPRLQTGLRPKISFQQLHDAFTKAG
jgi:heme-degrading monooxygenase HmoA